jgi:shikimate dehydrogenase
VRTHDAEAIMSQTSFLSRLIGSFSTSAAQNPTVAIMEAAFVQAGLDVRYLNCEVPPEHLAAAVRGAVAMGWIGFNCSIPHKVTVLDHLDELAPSAAIIGAVNCVVIDDGRLIGENTDGQGFLASLREVIDPADREVVVFGAGGAARAIAVESALAGARHITIVNRDEGRGAGLAALIAGRTPASAEYRPWTPRFAVPATADVVINATSIGFHPNVEGRLDVDVDTLLEGMVVADVVVNPPRTRWLQDARARGCTTLTGLGMLVNQGLIGVRLWTGEEVSGDVMRATLEEIFGA